MDFGSISSQERNILVALGTVALLLVIVLIVIVISSSGSKPPAQEPTLAVALSVPTQAKATDTPIPSRTPKPTNTLVVAIEDYNRPLVERITEEVVGIRQLAPAEATTFRLLNREQMAAEMQTLHSLEEIRADIDREWLLYEVLGLVSQGTGLSDEQVEQFANQFSGLYLPDQDHLYVVTDRVNMNKEDEFVFAHEYTHALQDEHFDLERYLLNATTTDTNLAARALVEGDATLVMALYAYGNTTQAQWDYVAYRASFAEEPKLAELEGISERASRIVGFPYAEGMNFVLTLFLEGGWPNVNRAFEDLPTSTEQVLHPEKYLGQRDWPQELQLPETPVDGWNPIWQDSLGEFVLRTHLDEFLDDPERAAAAAAGWDGDRIGLWQDGEGRWLVLWRTVWDNSDEAAEFEGAYQALIPARFEGVTAIGGGWWQKGNLIAGVLRENERVWLVWGPDRATVEAVLEASR